jgi:hypothetical protein
MDDKDRFDRFVALANFRLRRWDARRNYEWKISLGLWGLLAASAYYIPIKPNMCVVSALLIIVFFTYVIFWSLPILVRNDEDMDTAFYYMKQAETVLDINVDAPEKPKQRLTIFQYFMNPKRWSINSGTWAPFFQIVATAVFEIATWWMLSQKPWPK